jgi:hypothetical protein
MTKKDTKFQTSESLFRGNFLQSGVLFVRQFVSNFDIRISNFAWGALGALRVISTKGF